ncbi:MAG TPA: TetR/AcrR family transcriptional regulator [Bdellovibrionota bacterium]|jgi:TetR/AcrR family transcriptional regulator|nr:TetR/AcrR family transcriptional regulator [Bdellovibrionota bacterium]
MAFKSRDPDRTRARILAEATRLFAKGGYAGTSTNEVVEACGVSKRMLFHYFGDKDGLYRAVVLQQWVELKEWFDESARAYMSEHGSLPADTATLLQESIRISSRFMAQRQDFVRLVMWDGLEGGRAANSIWKEVRGPLFVQVEFLLRQAQSEGLLPKDMEPAQLVISFLGAVSFYYAYAHTLKEIIPDPLGPASLKAREDHVVKLLSSVFTARRN